MEHRDRDHARHLSKNDGGIVVFSIRTASRCPGCSADLIDGDYLTFANDTPSCMKCAKLDDLVLLPAGDPAITRRASKHSGRKAVVLRWSKPGKRYERQGTLVEAAAIELAKAECAADADKREAKKAKAAVKRAIEDQQYQEAFAAELKRMYPGCPAAEASDITEHACEKYSGRVGRSAAAKDLDGEMIRLAVVAHIRHIHTKYDEFLMSGVSRDEARRLIHAKIERVLADWETPAKANV